MMTLDANMEGEELILQPGTSWQRHMLSSIRKSLGNNISNQFINYYYKKPGINLELFNLEPALRSRLNIARVCFRNLA